MKTIILIVLVFSVKSHAQVTGVNLQASGLTCSMCSNAINKALKTISYVEKVTPNIKNSSFEISFKPNAQVDFDQLRKKVENAGFYVAKLTATFHFDNLKVKNDEHINVHGFIFHFLNIKEQTLQGDKTIQLLDKGYVSAKQFKKNQVYTNMVCYKTGTASTCCTKAGIAQGSRIFHVTI